MGGIVDSIFGKTKEQTKKVTPAPPAVFPSRGFDLSTGYGGVRALGGDAPRVTTSTLIPSLIEAFQRDRNSHLGIGAQIQGDIGELRRLENPFIRARVRPLEQQYAAGRGGLERNLARRGVFGQLGQNTLSQYDEDANRQIADQQALAQSDAMAAIRAAQALRSQEISKASEATNARLAANLADLGLGADLIKMVLADRTIVNQGGGETVLEEPNDTGAKLLGNIAAAFLL